MFYSSATKTKEKILFNKNIIKQVNSCFIYEHSNKPTIPTMFLINTDTLAGLLHSAAILFYLGEWTLDNPK